MAGTPEQVFQTENSTILGEGIRVEDENGRYLGDLVVIETTTNGLDKTVRYPAIAARIPGVVEDIPIAPFPGIAILGANAGHQAEFVRETEITLTIDQSGENVFTGEKGLPAAVPETRINYENGSPNYMAQKVVPFGLELSVVMKTVLEMHRTMLDDVPFRPVDQQKSIEIQRAFAQAILFKFMMGAFASLQDLNTTKVASDTDMPGYFSVVLHNDVNVHGGNTLHVGLPGSNFGTSWIIDLGRASITPVPVFSKETMYQHEPFMSENEGFVLILKQLLNSHQQLGLLSPELQRNTVWTVDQLHEAYNRTLTAIIFQTKGAMTVEQLDEQIQHNFLRVYLRRVIGKAQADTGLTPYEREEIEPFAKSIRELFSEDAPTQTMRRLRINPPSS